MKADPPAIAPALFHTSHPQIPEKARAMMGDVHRANCARAAACPTPRDRSGQVRATWYARQPVAESGRVAVRIAYLCHQCARVFARAHAISMETIR